MHGGGGLYTEHLAKFAIMLPTTRLCLSTFYVQKEMYRQNQTKSLQGKALVRAVKETKMNDRFSMKRVTPYVYKIIRILTN